LEKKKKRKRKKNVFLPFILSFPHKSKYSEPFLQGGLTAINREAEGQISANVCPGKGTQSL